MLNLGLNLRIGGFGGGVLRPPQFYDIAQWIKSYDGTFELVDGADFGLDLPDVVGVNLMNFVVGGTITTDAVYSIDTLHHQGSATLTANNGSITVGPGTVSLIQVNGEYVYPCEAGVFGGSGGDEIYPVDGSGNIATVSGAVVEWTKSLTKLKSWNLRYGGTWEQDVTAGTAYTVTGVTGTDTITHSGTSVPTAGTDSITFGAGTVRDVYVNGDLRLTILNDGEWWDVVEKTALIPTSGSSETKYIPALEQDTVGSIKITDTANDKLSVPGIVPTDTITIQGGGTATAGTDEITFDLSGIYSGMVQVNGEDLTDLSEIVGKTATSLTSLNASYPTINVQTGAGGLESLYSRRLSGTSYGTPIRVDAKYSLPIERIGTIDDPRLVHNFFEGGVQQTDVYFSDNPNGTWHDGASFQDIYIEQILDHQNGLNNLWFRWKDIDGKCYVESWGQYKLDPYWMPTPTEYIRNLMYWTVCGSASSPLEPLEVTQGTGIGPDEDWMDNGEGKVILVGAS
jgi:hypothetical protein